MIRWLEKAGIFGDKGGDCIKCGRVHFHIKTIRGKRVRWIRSLEKAGYSVTRAVTA